MAKHKHTKYLEVLTKNVAIFISGMDHVMNTSSTLKERGISIGKLVNELQMANDSAMHFGLEYGWKKINNIKNQTKRIK